MKNPDITQFAAEALSFIGGDVIFTSNWAFAECLVEGLVKQVEQSDGVDGVLSSSENNEDCVCSSPPGALFAMCF